MPSVAKVKIQILTCTNCDLYKTCKLPVPFTGPAPSKIAVIGEAPGKQEDELTQPFVGPAGQLARRWLAKVGIDPLKVAWLNVVCCLPPDTRNPRTPASAEIIACRINLYSQLAVIQPSRILVLGATALSVFQPELRVSSFRGNWWRINYQGGQAWAMSTYHPAAVLRSPMLGQEVSDDVANFAVVAAGLFDPPTGQECVKCGMMAQEWRDSVGWCKKHLPKVSRRKVRKENLGKQEKMI